MGFYDSVLVPCPKCGIEIYFQTKGGERLFANYSLAEAPEDVMSDVNRHAPYLCECGTWFKVSDNERKAVAVDAPPKR